MSDTSVLVQLHLEMTDPSTLATANAEPCVVDGPSIRLSGATSNASESTGIGPTLLLASADSGNSRGNSNAPPYDLLEATTTTAPDSSSTLNEPTSPPEGTTNNEAASRSVLGTPPPNIVDMDEPSPQLRKWGNLERMETTFADGYDSDGQELSLIHI